MLSMNARLAVLALVAGLGAATVSPVAGQPHAASEESDFALALARSVSETLTGRRAEVYAPTGEHVDLTLTVEATRL